MSDAAFVFSRPPVIPLWVKLGYTAFMAVLLPVYWWAYSPLNFLWFCDAALITTLVAIWLESPLLTSMQAVGIVLPQLLWQIDFLLRLVGFDSPLDAAEYMFDHDTSLFARGLSLFHGWLPILLVWMVWKLGYDRRALFWQTVFLWCLLLTTYLLVSAPDGPAKNVNKVFGWTDLEPQTMMPQIAWVGCMMLVIPTLIYFPSHLFFRWLFRPPIGERE